MGLKLLKGNYISFICTHFYSSANTPPISIKLFDLCTDFVGLLVKKFYVLCSGCLGSLSGTVFISIFNFSCIFRLDLEGVLDNDRLTQSVLERFSFYLKGIICIRIFGIEELIRTRSSPTRFVYDLYLGRP